MNYQKIVPHLWFDKKVVEAVQWYTSIFPNSEIIRKDIFKGMPSGKATQVMFKLMGYEFMATDAGPYTAKNPSISFNVQINRNNEELVDKLYKRLQQDGKVLMPLDKYPFNDKYAWVEDKYGISWQLWLQDYHNNKNNIVPSLMFANDNKGNAEEAMAHYVDTFKKSEHLASVNYPAGMEPDTEDMIMHGEVRLFNKRFSFNDSGHAHDFDFSKGVSLLVKCDNQKELDQYWEKLSAMPEAEEPGWLKDKFGVSWQIVPKVMDKMLAEGTPEQISHVTQTFLKMKKIDIGMLEEAYNKK